MLDAASPFPAGGIFVPAILIYNPYLPPVVVHTWIQLRGLAGSEGRTRPYTISDLCALTGKGQTALYSHLAVLKSSGLIRCRTAARGALVLIFEDFEDVDAPAARTPILLPPPTGEPVYVDENAQAAPPEDDFDQTPPPDLHLAGPQPDPAASTPAPIPASRNSGITEIRNSDFPELRKNEIPPSLKPPNLIKNKNLEEEEAEAEKFQDSGIPESRKSKSKKSKTGWSSDDPVEIFRLLTGRSPNQAQRYELHAAVADPDLWRQSVAHWLKHGWNPTNVLGQLDFYRKGGPPSCRACKVAGSKSNGPHAIDELLRELTDNSTPEDPHGHTPAGSRPAQDPF